MINFQIFLELSTCEMHIWSAEMLKWHSNFGPARSRKAVHDFKYEIQRLIAPCHGPLNPRQKWVRQWRFPSSWMTLASKRTRIAVPWVSERPVYVVRKTGNYAVRKVGWDIFIHFEARAPDFWSIRWASLHVLARRERTWGKWVWHVSLSFFFSFLLFSVFMSQGFHYRFRKKNKG